jgi:hypothetical protein
MELTVTYTNREGQTWTLRDLANTILPGFFEATRDDGQRVVVHRDRMKITKENPHALRPGN